MRTLAFLSLIGKPLLVTVAVVTIAAPVATLLLWHRVRGPRAVRLVSRVALVVTSQLAAVVLTAVALNDYGYFFTTWGDLFGSHSTGPLAIRHVAGGPLGSGPAPGQWGAGVHVLRYLPWSPRALWPQRGAVAAVRIVGLGSGLWSDGYVYLPPQYFQPRYANRRFPAVEVFTGYPGDALNLIKRLHYPDEMLADIQHGTAPTVLVMVRPSVTYPRDTECTDVPNGPRAFSYFAKDVPAVVSSAFRVEPGPWGAIGDSTGGYCAAKLAMLAPRRFVAAVSLSGYYHAIRDVTTGDLYGGSPARRRANDLMWRLQHRPPPAVSVLVGTSRTEQGPDGYQSAQAFLRLVRSPMSADEIVAAHGGHTFSTWQPMVGPSLRWLSGKLAAGG